MLILAGTAMAQGRERITAAEFYEQHHELGEASCPGGEWTQLEADEGSVLYERKTGACGSNAPQHALFRVLCGKQKIYQLTYTSKAGLSGEDRDRWIGVLRGASIG